MTSKEVLWYLTRHWSSPFTVRQQWGACPNVSWGWGLEHEADLILVSNSGYVTEIEIKVSLSDWKRDMAKEKHQRMRERQCKKIKRFFYAGPQTLMERYQEIEALPEYAGIVGIIPEQHRGDDPVIAPSNYVPGRVTVLRKHKDLKPCEKVELQQINELNRLTALRYWDSLEVQT